jgi:hypothetical protein
MAQLYWKVKSENGKWRWVKQEAPFPVNPAVISQCHCKACAMGIVNEIMTEEE